MASKEEKRRLVGGLRDKRDDAAGVLREAQHRDQHAGLLASSKRKPRLVEVAIEPQQSGPGFALVLANGRRIESSWRFAEADLLRLIRVAEA